MSGPTSRHDELRAELERAPRTWLVTGAVGFIGSHLLERLLAWGQRVRAVDDFSTGRRRNLDEVRAAVGEERWRALDFREGDVGDARLAAELVEGADVVLHQAALGSVPRSMADPRATFVANVEAFHTLLVAATRASRPPRFVFASSSSVYGDHPDQPRREDVLGAPLSPYAASKRADEVLASGFQRAFGLETVALRYFNVFGPRQDPEGPYAAVIPRWIAALLAGERPELHGDGLTSRDFCPVANVVRANLLAATAPAKRVAGEVFNVGLGGCTTLAELLDLLVAALARLDRPPARPEPVRTAPRPGDVRESSADIAKARERLRYEPEFDLAEGLRETAAWYAGKSPPAASIDARDARPRAGL